MKKELNPKVTVAVIAVVALIAVGMIVWSFAGPSVRVASAPNPNADTHRTAEQTREIAQQRRMDMMARRNHQQTPNSSGN
jgi:hypothetical protein